MTTVTHAPKDTDADEVVPTSTSAAAPRPRIRWAGIVWGLVFAGIAISGMNLSSTPDHLDGLAAWLQGLELGAAIGYGLLVVGGLVLVIGVVGLLRRAQRAVADRHPSPGPAEEILVSEEPMDVFSPQDEGSPR